MSRTAHKWSKFPVVTSIRYDDVVTAEDRLLYGRSAGVSRLCRTREAFHPVRKFAPGESVAAAVAVFRASDRREVRDELRYALAVVSAVARTGKTDWIDGVDDTKVPTRQNRHSVQYDVL